MRQVFTDSFLRDVKLIKKDRVLFDRLNKKIDEVMENPERYPMKKYDLKGKRGVHVGPYVLLFEIIGEDVVFLKFTHHDEAYRV